MDKLNRPLGLILIIHVVMGIAFNLATPIFEAPDEDGHFLFVRYLQIHRTLPVQGADPFGPRAHHPPLYHALGALLSAWVPVGGSAERIDMALNPHVWFRYEDPDIDNKAMWVHYGPEERWPYRGQALAVHLIRLLSVGFSALAVWFTYQAAGQLRPGDTSFAVLSTGLVAFNSMVLFMSGVVQNSTAALASGIGILYALSWGVRRGFTFMRWAVVGTVFGLGVLLQTSALTLGVCIMLVVMYETWRAKRARPLFEGLVGVLVPIALLDGWWFIRNHRLYGDWTANSTIAALWATDGSNMPLSQALYLVGTGLIGRFGQGLIIDFPRWTYYTAGLIALLALAGGVKSIFDSLPPLPQTRRWRRFVALEGLTADAFLWALHTISIVVVTGALVVYVYWFIHGVHGRFLFTVFPSVALVFARGLLAWFPARRQPLVAASVVASALALALYGLFGLLIPTYAMPRSPTQTELSQMTSLDAQIGHAARVLGYQLKAESVKSGQLLEVTVYWLPQTATDTPFTVFVHLYEPSVGSITQRDTYPGLGNYATTVWDPERPFVDTYHLRLPAEAPPVSGAKILLGLYDQQTMQRLSVTGRDAGPAEDAWVEFGDIQVQP